MRHIHSHTKEKPFSCAFCPKSCNRRYIFSPRSLTSGSLDHRSGANLVDDGMRGLL